MNLYMIIYRKIACPQNTEAAMVVYRMLSTRGRKSSWNIKLILKKKLNTVPMKNLDLAGHLILKHCLA